MNTQVILGPGGCGKSTLLRERIAADPNYAVLTASTGIAAVNLGPGVTTVHSALGFYDLRSLHEAHSRGNIRYRAIQLAKRKKKFLVLDEISMVSGDHLSIIHDAFTQAAQYIEEKNANSVGMDRIDPCGLLLSGDYCQLSPISDDKTKPAPFAFESPCYAEHYEPNTVQLTKVWRQDNPQFLEALTLARKGRGVDAAFALKDCGVQFAQTECEEFDGITLFPVNAQVDSYNARRLAALPGDEIKLPSKRWGRCAGEWKNIPDELVLKDGALVMVLVNQPKTFEYVNGDLATLACVDELGAHVKTKRGFEGVIPKTIRRNVSYADKDSLESAFRSGPWAELYDVPKGSNEFKRWYAKYMDYIASQQMRERCYYDPKEHGTVVGEVEYTPLRVAYASSYHKVQGLTLDKCQISMNHFWAGQPGMLYVALTRCRTPEGLRIVGDVAGLSKKIKTDKRVMRWV